MIFKGLARKLYECIYLCIYVIRNVYCEKNKITVRAAATETGLPLKCLHW